MGHYTVEKDGDTRTYKENGKLVVSDKVPTNTKNALEEAAPGAIVDEFGEAVDTSTETDESEDEAAPGPVKTPDAEQDEPDLDDSDDELEDEDSEETDPDEEEGDETNPEDESKPAPKPKPRKPRPAEPEPAPTIPDQAVEQDEPGMGYKRSKGKTLSIFSNKPHETVKYVGGHTVPLTREEYDEKTDAEIIEQLKKIKKIK